MSWHHGRSHRWAIWDFLLVTFVSKIARPALVALTHTPTLPAISFLLSFPSSVASEWLLSTKNTEKQKSTVIQTGETNPRHFIYRTGPKEMESEIFIKNVQLKTWSRSMKTDSVISKIIEPAITWINLG